jgi:hypothetical protein
VGQAMSIVVRSWRWACASSSSEWGTRSEVMEIGREKCERTICESKVLSVDCRRAERKGTYLNVKGRSDGERNEDK